MSYTESAPRAGLQGMAAKGRSKYQAKQSSFAANYSAAATLAITNYQSIFSGRMGRMYGNALRTYAPQNYASAMSNPSIAAKWEQRWLQAAMAP
ncbi:MAG: hypothetical protein QW429_03485 [Thermoprotei archaeon]